MSSLAPIPKWYNPDDTLCLSWDAGIVDADTYSAIKEVYVWNNRGTSSASPSTDVSDMTGVFITTKNTDGTDSGSVATQSDAIVEVSAYDGSNWGTFTPVGGSANTLQLTNGAGEVGYIRGTGNDGNKLTVASKKNFARIQLRLHVLPTAPAGAINWKTRVSYQYV